MFTCTLHRCETKWCTYMMYCDNVHIHIINSQFPHLPAVEGNKTPALMLCCCQVCSWLFYEFEKIHLINAFHQVIESMLSAVSVKMPWDMVLIWPGMWSVQQWRLDFLTSEIHSLLLFKQLIVWLLVFCM